VCVCAVPLSSSLSLRVGLAPCIWRSSRRSTCTLQRTVQYIELDVHPQKRAMECREAKDCPICRPCFVARRSLRGSSSISKSQQSLRARGDHRGLGWNADGKMWKDWPISSLSPLHSSSAIAASLSMGRGGKQPASQPSQPGKPEMGCGSGSTGATRSRAPKLLGNCSIRPKTISGPPFILRRASLHQPEYHNH
jgi:hypothetical protein